MDKFKEVMRLLTELYTVTDENDVSLTDLQRGVLQQLVMAHKLGHVRSTKDKKGTRYFQDPDGNLVMYFTALVGNRFQTGNLKIVKMLEWCVKYKKFYFGFFQPTNTLILESLYEVESVDFYNFMINKLKKQGKAHLLSDPQATAIITMGSKFCLELGKKVEKYDPQLKLFV